MATANACRVAFMSAKLRVTRKVRSKAGVRQCMCLQGGGQLRDYQLDGLNWMVYAWSKGMNAILADVSRQHVLWCWAVLGGTPALPAGSSA